MYAMSFIVIAVVVVFLSIVGIGVGKCFSQSNEPKPVTSETVTRSSRSDLDDMLSQIEKKAAPEEKMGAMCYDVATAPEYQQYICPTDGEKTVYDRKNLATYETISNIVGMRRLVEHINSLTQVATFALDEKKLCYKCSPLLKNADRFASLVVKYPDGKEHIYERITIEDLRILTGFFEKKLTYTTANEGEKPLKNELDRIKKILKGNTLEH